MHKYEDINFPERGIGEDGPGVGLDGQRQYPCAVREGHKRDFQGFLHSPSTVQD